MMNKEQISRLEDAFAKLQAYLEQPKPTLVLDEGGKPVEFSFMPLQQYGNLRTKSYEG